MLSVAAATEPPEDRNVVVDVGELTEGAAVDGEVEKRALQFFQANIKCVDGVAHPKLHVGDDLIVAASTRVQFPTQVAQPFDQCVLDVGVNVFKCDREGHFPALDHRFTISNTDFQPPFGGSLAPFETYVLPLLDGTGPTRLVGAKLTTVVLDSGNGTLAQWITYAKSKGFFDRLFYYPVDEPGSSGPYITY